MAMDMQAADSNHCASTKIEFCMIVIESVIDYLICIAALLTRLSSRSVKRSESQNPGDLWCQ